MRWCDNAGTQRTKQLAMLIEYPAHSSSAFAQHVANKKGYALRISAPRRLEKALTKQSKKLPKPTTKPPNEPPKLRAGKVVTWRIDLRISAHRKRFTQFIEELSIPKKVSIVHMHSSPPCGRASSLTPWNEKMQAAFQETSEEFLQRLTWVRAVHKAFHRSCQKLQIQHTGSHEQSARCRLQFVSNTKKGWPWALNARAAQPRAKSTAVVHGCALGLRVQKKWRFESNNEAMIKVLKQIVCPGCQTHELIVAQKGRKGCGTKNSEKYPSLLGRILAETLMRRSKYAS